VRSLVSDFRRVGLFHHEESELGDTIREAFPRRSAARDLLPSRRCRFRLENERTIMEYQFAAA